MSIPNSLHIHFCLDKIHKKHEIHSSLQNILFICTLIYISFIFYFSFVNTGTNRIIGGEPAIDEDDAEYKLSLSKKELAVLLDDEDYLAQQALDKEREADEKAVSHKFVCFSQSFSCKLRKMFPSHSPKPNTQPSA